MENALLDYNLQCCSIETLLSTLFDNRDLKSANLHKTQTVNVNCARNLNKHLKQILNKKVDTRQGCKKFNVFRIV